MMKITIIVILYLTICSCFNALAQYTLNDIPYNMTEINHRDPTGRKQGVWYLYNKYSLQVYRMNHYRNDTLHGYFECYWHTTGTISTKGFYKNGKLDSLHIAYWENGKERGKAFFKNGLLNGVAVTHNKNGVLTSQVLYVEGKIDSSYQEMYYDPNFQLEDGQAIKMDTIYTSWINDKYERYAIYKNDVLIELYNLKKGVIINKSFFENKKEVKRIIYCEKKPYCIKKIFYYNEGVLQEVQELDLKCKCK